MHLRQNIPLLVGLAIPVLMILFVAGSIFIPSMFIHPTYDFVYSEGSDYYNCRWTYEVKNGKYVRMPGIVDPYAPDKTLRDCQIKLYRYDAQKDDSVEVSFEDVEKLALDDRPVSPEGFEIARGSGGGDFPFFYGGSSYNDMFLRRGAVSKRIKLHGTNNGYYYYDFRFIGWVLPQ